MPYRELTNSLVTSFLSFFVIISYPELDYADLQQLNKNI